MDKENIFLSITLPLIIEKYEELIINNISRKKEGEIFVPIQCGYKNYYISNLGRIYNAKTKRISNGCLESSGYVRFKLISDDKIIKCVFVHQLVATHFIPNPEKKIEVNHLKEKHENQYYNLEWVTPFENKKHAAENITKFKMKSVQILDADTFEVIETYNSMSNIKGFNSNGIYKAIKENREYKGYRWKYTDTDIQNMIIEGEVWVSLKKSIYKEINIYNYEVSNMGRIKSNYTNNILKIDYRNKVQLSEKGKTKGFYIHRLVIMGFNKENPENKEEVDHIDSNPKNNKLENLRWANRKEQMNNTETIKKMTGPNYNNRDRIKVTKDGVEKIYIGQTILIKELHIAQRTIKKYSESGDLYKGYKIEIL